MNQDEVAEPMLAVPVGPTELCFIFLGLLGQARATCAHPASVAWKGLDCQFVDANMKRIKPNVRF